MPGRYAGQRPSPRAPGGGPIWRMGGRPAALPALEIVAQMSGFIGRSGRIWYLDYSPLKLLTFLLWATTLVYPRCVLSATRNNTVAQVGTAVSFQHVSFRDYA